MKKAVPEFRSRCSRFVQSAGQPAVLQIYMLLFRNQSESQFTLAAELAAYLEFC